MNAKLRHRRSLLALLSAIVVLSVVIVFGIHATYLYFSERDRIIASMQHDGAESLERLTKNIAPFIEAYAVNEYEKLVATEIQMHSLHAIVVEDFNFGRILGQQAYITGKIHATDNTVVDFDGENLQQRENIKTVFFTESTAILSDTGVVLGKVSVYFTDAAIKRELKRVLHDTMVATVLLALVLIAMLAYFSRTIFVRPLSQITQHIGQTDSDGIPRTAIPDFNYREISVLTDTMNAMLNVIRRARDSLLLERTRLHNVIAGTRVGTWEWNVQTGETILNERWAEIVGYSLEELSPVSIKTWINLTHPDDLEKSNNLLGQHFLGELPYYECEVRMRHKKGHWVWVIDRGKVSSWDGAAKPLLMSGTHQDITERKHAEEKLTQAASVFTHAREAILIADINGGIIDVNHAFTQITGYHREEVLGQNPRILKSGRHHHDFYQDLWKKLLGQGYWSGEIWNKRKDGELYAGMLTISALRENDGSIQRFVALYSDITALKEQQYQLEHLAHYDILTDLPNRLTLSDRLRQAMLYATRHQQIVAVIFLDLDGFKDVNDSHGHEVGDQLLMTVATRMKQVLRDNDTLARLGGDEFVAVLPYQNDIQSSLPILARLQAAAAEGVRLKDKTLRTSASIGVTFFPQVDDVDADQLLRQADQAMYQAKLSGKNQYQFFDAEQDRHLRGHHETLKRGYLALENQEFVLFYQPKVNMRSGKVVGAEALIRWQHPEQGILPPGAFLPAMTDNPLMLEVGKWTLKQALKQMGEWGESGIYIPISVNIAAYQLQRSDFVSQLRQILDQHSNVDPRRLELEILETSALENMDHVSKVIRECRQLGVSFSLDDFGTGYSSLTYLKHLPAQVLKIDQSFVRDMLEDPEDLAILEGVIGLAGAFQRQVIAEGVETTEHGEMLLMLGCELGQGYGIAKPMPARDLAHWIESWCPDPSWKDCSAVERDRLPLLFMTVGIRAWMASVEQQLSDTSEEPLEMPELHPYSENMFHGLEEPDIEFILAARRDLVERCTELFGLRKVEDEMALKSKITALRELCDSFTAKVKLIMV